MKNIPLFIILPLLLSSPAFAQGQNYGAPVAAYPALPGWQERAVHALTNACRTDPVGFRTAYLDCDTILKPQNYPATTPLYWNVNLNRSSHDHSVDMATVCGMQHPSCNSTAWDVRVKSYYTPGYPIGENIATGYATPREVMRGWLREANPPAPDSSGSDGHRANIMDPRYKVLGVGYAYGAAIQWYHFWTQDFGGGTSVYAYHPVASGSHHFPDASTVMFLATFYDPQNLAPQEAALYINGTKYTLTRQWGTNARGTYTLSQTKSTACRRYWFSFTRSGGTVWRYPETGALVTSGEGACQTVYVPPESLAVHGSRISPNAVPDLSIVRSAAGLVLRCNVQQPRPVRTFFLNLDGTVSCHWTWPAVGTPELSAPLPAGTRPGVYLFRTVFSDNRERIDRIVFVR